MLILGAVRLILNGAGEQGNDSRNSAEANDGDGVAAEVTSVGGELLGDLSQSRDLLDHHVGPGRTRHANRTARC